MTSTDPVRRARRDRVADADQALVAALQAFIEADRRALELFRTPGVSARVRLDADAVAAAAQRAVHIAAAALARALFIAGARPGLYAPPATAAELRREAAAFLDHDS